MMQYSIYVRVCTNQTMADSYMEKVNRHLPSDGAVRGLIITEKQYEKMKIFLGVKSKNEKIITDRRIIIF